ncbi:MAG TPA: hypothetical protein VEF34_17975 [Syntrophobacteraceae bacterium]|nr:hypothetical protein [Syntrophobacteraceae bacterium]
MPLRDLNWRKGFFRLWVLASSIWVLVFGTLWVCTGIGYIKSLKAVQDLKYADGEAILDPAKTLKEPKELTPNQETRLCSRRTLAEMSDAELLLLFKKQVISEKITEFIKRYTPFDLRAARQAGKTDDEIADYLSHYYGADKQAAIRTGMTPTQIAEFLASLKPKDVAMIVFQKQGCSKEQSARIIEKLMNIAPENQWEIVSEKPVDKLEIKPDPGSIILADKTPINSGVNDDVEYLGSDDPDRFEYLGPLEINNLDDIDSRIEAFLEREALQTRIVYSIHDPQSGKKFLFYWILSIPPTIEDMREIFAVDAIPEKLNFIAVNKATGFKLTSDEISYERRGMIEYVRSGKWYEQNVLAKSKESRKRDFLLFSGMAFLPPIVTMVLGIGVMWAFSGFVPKQSQ